MSKKNLDAYSRTLCGTDVFDQILTFAREKFHIASFRTFYVPLLMAQRRNAGSFSDFDWNDLIQKPETLLTSSKNSILLTSPKL